jgi:ABC-type transporter Mla MlaB component
LSSIAVDDKCDKLRLVIKGALTGQTVNQLAEAWKLSQSEPYGPPIVVDISSLVTCDPKGEMLLSQMMDEGHQFSARTAESLVLLGRITRMKARFTQALAARSHNVGAA